MPSSNHSSSLFVGALIAFFGAGALMQACGGDVDAAHYGPPNGLNGKAPSVVGDTGAPAPTGTGTGPGGSSLCGGKGPIDAGACAVSWKTDIYPQMQPTGHWKCSDTAACHGSKASGVTPLIDPTNASTAYDQLSAYSVTGNGSKPYISPCSTDPTASSIVCNTKTANACGALPMPVTSNPPGGAALTADEAQKLATWVGCGSPNN